MSLLFRLSSFALLLVVAAAARAQTLPPLDEFYIRTFASGVRGLPASDVRDIQQTTDGYLYVAQGHGLSRFNGYRFDPIDLPGARSRFVERSRLGSDGRLWIFTRANGVGYLKRDRFQLLPQPPITPVNVWQTNDRLLRLVGFGSRATRRCGAVCGSQQATEYGR
jgi:ligand-binding sensor domain-containing protein